LKYFVHVLGLPEIAGLDIDGRVKNGVGQWTLQLGLDNGGPDTDGRIWAIDCNQLKITTEGFYQLTGTYDSFDSVLCRKTYGIHTYKQKLRRLAASRFAGIATGVFHCNN